MLRKYSRFFVGFAAGVAAASSLWMILNSRSSNSDELSSTPSFILHPPPPSQQEAVPQEGSPRCCDFRSDTVTKPTAEMYSIIPRCPVGDDVLGDDPTVQRLEAKAAALFGKEAGLFVVSGTMGNQLACRSLLTIPTFQVVLDKRAHIYQYELGGVAHHCGCSCRTIMPANGDHLTCDEIEKELILTNDWHHPMTKLICLENTIQGHVFPIQEIRKIARLAQRHRLKMHLDGARIWNASVASGVSLQEYGKYFDTVSACLSKGLGAPIGTVLVGSKAVIERARRYRKMYGGGWRQAGFLAGCGLYAIEHHFPKMREDHARARKLGEALVGLGFELQRKIETNWVLIGLGSVRNTDFDKISKIVARYGFRMMPRGDDVTSCRLVVHLQTTDEDVDAFVGLLRKIVRNAKSSRRRSTRK